MPQFTVNTHRFDPYQNYRFRVKWDGRYVAGITKVSSLRRSTEVVKHREGGDPSSSRKSPGRTEYEAISLERGGYHIMLMGLTGTLTEGEMHKVTLIFEHAGRVEVEFMIDPPMAEGMEGMDHSKMDGMQMDEGSN